MSVVKQIEETYRVRALQRGGYPKYQFETALDILDSCEKARCRIFGIDGLHITPTTTQPDTGHALDISHTPYDYEAARAFLNARRGESDLFFEFVLGEPI